MEVKMASKGPGGVKQIRVGSAFECEEWVSVHSVHFSDALHRASNLGPNIDGWNWNPILKQLSMLCHVKKSSLSEARGKTQTLVLSGQTQIQKDAVRCEALQAVVSNFET